MKKYLNASGKSGVEAYESGADWIKVQFIESKKVYTYNYKKTGRHHVEKMKQLAKTGNGLATYISKYVKDLYDFFE